MPHRSRFHEKRGNEIRQTADQDRARERAQGAAILEPFFEPEFEPTRKPQKKKEKVPISNGVRSAKEFRLWCFRCSRDLALVFSATPSGAVPNPAQVRRQTLYAPFFHLSAPRLFVCLRTLLSDAWGLTCTNEITRRYRGVTSGQQWWSQQVGVGQVQTLPRMYPYRKVALMVQLKKPTAQYHWSWH